MGRGSSGGGRSRASGSGFTGRGRIINVFGKDIGPATRPNRSQMAEFNRIASGRYGDIANRYRDRFVNGLDEAGREAFLGVLRDSGVSRGR